MGILFLSLESGCINKVITSEVSCCRINNALLGGKEFPPVPLCQVDTSEGVIACHTRSGKQVLVDLNADTSKWP